MPQVLEHVTQGHRQAKKTVTAELYIILLLFFNWSLTAFQSCGSFLCITNLYSYVYVCPLPFEPPSHPNPPSPSHPSRSSQSTNLSSLC